VAVTQARAEVLADVLAALAPSEQATLERLAGKMLAGMMRGPCATRWICRLCDVGVCRGADDRCPVRSAARGRYLD
jgi:rubrerythrin